jgi:hypothetical protein
MSKETNLWNAKRAVYEEKRKNQLNQSYSSMNGGLSREGVSAPTTVGSHLPTYVALGLAAAVAAVPVACAMDDIHQDDGQNHFGHEVISGYFPPELLKDLAPGLYERANLQASSEKASMWDLQDFDPSELLNLIIPNLHMLKLNEELNYVASHDLVELDGKIYGPDRRPENWPFMDWGLREYNMKGNKLTWKPADPMQGSLGVGHYEEKEYKESGVPMKKKVWSSLNNYHQKLVQQIDKKEIWAYAPYGKGNKPQWRCVESTEYYDDSPRTLTNFVLNNGTLEAPNNLV